MRFLGTTIICVLLLFKTSSLSGQPKASKVFLMEYTQSQNWCAYDDEAAWNAAVHDAQAIRVGTLTYSNDHLSEIDVTETDETGDWTVYDQYFLSQLGEITRLSRMINVLPGDRSVLQTFSFEDGEAKQISSTQKELSTGKPLSSPKSVWLPELAITKDIKLFPFFGLLQRPDLRKTTRSCMHENHPISGIG